MGNVAHDQGDYTSVRSLHEEGLAIEQELGDEWRIAYSLEAFAALRVVEGEFEQAARLWGAAEALREALAAPLPPNNRPRYERDVAAARNQLDEIAFAAAWAENDP